MKTPPNKHFILKGENNMNYKEAFDVSYVPENIKNTVIKICQRFVISGFCNRMYISNIIAVESNIGDGRGNFTGGQIGDTQRIAERIQGIYGCNIQKSEIPELKKILETGEINKQLAIEGLKSFIERNKEEMKTCDEWRIGYLSFEIAEAEEFLNGELNA